MAKYSATFKLSGYHTIEVEADSPEEAKELARAEISDVDCGELADIDGDVNTIYDENDDIVWER